MPEPRCRQNVAVWRSVRLHGDTKTEKSRRTLALPQNAVTALREHRKWQAASRLAAGPLWRDTGLVFTTSVGTPLDAKGAELLGGMSGRFLPRLPSISSRIWSVHLAWTRLLCAMRMSRSRCALPYSALAS